MRGELERGTMSGRRMSEGKGINRQCGNLTCIHTSSSPRWNSTSQQWVPTDCKQHVTQMCAIPVCNDASDVALRGSVRQEVLPLPAAARGRGIQGPVSRLVFFSATTPPRLSAVSLLVSYCHPLHNGL